MRNLKLILAYDGTSFFGWQTSNSGPTVEETLQKTLEQILQHPITLQAASRTDRGVHAKGQVVNFFTDNSMDIRRLAYSLNALLPSTLVVRSIEQMPEHFHPTLDAQKKEYLYTICNSPIQLPEYRLFSWHIPKPLNLELMHKKSLEWIGTHDFAPFCNQHEGKPYESTIRTLTAVDILPIEDQRIKISLKGDHFLYKMARNLVGTLVDIGLGKNVNRGVCAPAHGLTLNFVEYMG